MRCSSCGHGETKVVDKRDASIGIRRRRECLHCGKRFTTYERVHEAQLVIVKKDGRREAFDAEKLKRGVMRACEKRPVSQEQIERLVERIETGLRKLQKREIKSSVIGKMVMLGLKKMDNVAYIRFASVYKEFKDIEDFKREIRQINH